MSRLTSFFLAVAYTWSSLTGILLCVDPVLFMPQFFCPRFPTSEGQTFRSRSTIRGTSRGTIDYQSQHCDSSVFTSWFSTAPDGLLSNWDSELPFDNSTTSRVFSTHAGYRSSFMVEDRPIMRRIASQIILLESSHKDLFSSCLNIAFLVLFNPKSDCFKQVFTFVSMIFRPRVESLFILVRHVQALTRWHAWPALSLIGVLSATMGKFQLCQLHLRTIQFYLHFLWKPSWILKRLGVPFVSLFLFLNSG